MTFANLSPHAALDVPLLDHTGRDVVVAIVKAAYERVPSGALVRAERRATILLNDSCHEPESPKSSLKEASDVCVAKVGTDVLVYGEAVARPAATHVDVVVQVGERSVPLRVHGPRLYYRGAGRMTIGPAAKFERMPLAYERAYGGSTEDYLVVDHRNPSGVGVHHRVDDLDGTPAPQLEHPLRPHHSAGDKHAPVGLGPIMSHWSPRRELAGTFDDAWLAERMPLMPLDFDLRFNNVAHPTLRVEPGLRAGDPFGVIGMSFDGPFTGSLPDLGVLVRARFETGPPVKVAPPIDTVILWPGDARIEVVARAAFAMGRGGNLLRELVVDTLLP